MITYLLIIKSIIIKHMLFIVYSISWIIVYSMQLSYNYLLSTSTSLLVIVYSMQLSYNYLLYPRAFVYYIIMYN